MFKAELFLAKFSVSTQNAAEEITFQIFFLIVQKSRGKMEEERTGVKREEKKENSLHISIQVYIH